MNNKNIILFLFSLFSFGVYSQDVISLCQGDNHNFGVPLTQGSNYNWQIQNSSIADITSGNGTNTVSLDLNLPGIFKLFVEETDINGCQGYDSIMVEINPLPLPEISFIGSLSFCEGDSVLLEVENTYDSFLWNNNSTSNSVYVSNTDNYYVTVTDSKGCINSTSSIFVQVNPKPKVDFIISESCLGSPTTFFNTSSVSQGDISSLFWYFENGDVLTGDTVQYIYNELGSSTVDLMIETDSGCVDLLSRSFSTVNSVVASFEFSPTNASTLEPFIDFTNTSTNGSIYYWDFDDFSFSSSENPTHEFQNAGIYNVTLTVSDTNRCIDSIQKNIIVYYDYVLYLPNSFTPNGDGENDNFGPKGFRIDKFKSYEFIIYNRWGDQIFYTQEYTLKWDGFNTQDGLYNWVITLEDELGEIRKERGEVWLIR